MITSSGLIKGKLVVDDLVKCDLKGNLVEGIVKPPIETPSQVAILRRRGDVEQ